MRLFISINCNDETKSHLLYVQEKIKSQAISGNFTRPENLHMTLIFLGEIKGADIPLICSIIKNATRQQELSSNLILSKADCFKHFNRELWWVGADSSDPFLYILRGIRQKIANGLSEKNIFFDNKQFKPHITLGREIKHDKPIVIPEQKINFPVKRISLMKSERIKGILAYTEIFGVNLEEVTKNDV